LGNPVAPPNVGSNTKRGRYRTSGATTSASSSPTCAILKSFAQQFFLNAHVVAEKCHVLGLFPPRINRRRVPVTGGLAFKVLGSASHVNGEQKRSGSAPGLDFTMRRAA
jgi:hypothetical protein